MARQVDAARLVAALEGATDPLARLRLVAGAARSLAALPAARRRRLLAGIGLAEAEVLIDRVVDDEGARSALQRALDALQADPQRARTLVRDLANPATRGRTLSGLLAFLEESLGEVPEGENAKEGEPAAAPAGEPSTGMPAAAAGSSPSTPSTPPPPAPTAPSPEPVAGVVASSLPASPDPAVEEPLSADASVAPPVPAAPPSPATATAREAERPASELPEPEMPDSLIHRLGAWRQAVTGPEADDRLLARLELWFPAGWPRRRALQALFAAGRPRRAREALGLAADLRGSERLWCLPLLERSREWSAPERAELARLAGVSAPAA